MTASEYQTRFDEYKAIGYQLIYVTGYASGTSSRYAAIWFSHSEGHRLRGTISVKSIPVDVR